MKTYRTKIELQGNADALGVPLNSIINVPAFRYCVYTIHGEMKLDIDPPEAIKAVIVALFTYVNDKAYIRRNDTWDVRDNSKDQNFAPWKRLNDSSKVKAESLVASVFGQVYYKNGKLGKGHYLHDTDKPEYLSQEEAKELARQGMNYIEILKHFYGEDIQIVKLDLMPYIYQGDYDGNNTEIAGIPYYCKKDLDNGETDLTIWDKGCGIVSTVMCIDAMCGYEGGSDYIRVKEAAQFAMSNSFGDKDNGYKRNGGTHIESFVPDYVAKFGLSGKFTDNINEVWDAIGENAVAVISVGPPFTEAAHIMALSNVESNGTIKPHNPNRIGYKNKDTEYTFNTLKAAFNGKAVIIRKGTVMFTIIKEGMSGEKVTQIEAALVKKGYPLIGNDGKDYEDDYYGSVTTRRVKEYQTANGIAVTGEVNEETWNLLMLPDEPINNIELIEQKIDRLAEIQMQIDALNDEAGTLLDEIKGLL